MTPTRPEPGALVLIRVLAIIQIAVGTLSLCGPILNLAGVPQAIANWQVRMVNMPGQRDATQMEEEFARRIPWFKEYVRGKDLSCIGLCLLMVVSGIGLLKLQRWAWHLTLVYCLLSVLYHIADTVFTITSLGPGMTEVMAEQMDAQMKAMPAGRGPRPDMGKFMREIMPVVMPVGGAIGLLFGIFYPLTVTVLLLLPMTRQVFRSKGALVTTSPVVGARLPPAEVEVVQRAPDDHNRPDR